MFQFSGPFKPRPADTTTSASSILTFSSETLIESLVNFDSVKLIPGFIMIGSDLFSFKPIEFFEMLKILISELISISQNALFEKVLLFTTKGFVELGSDTTFETNAALSFTESREARYLQFTLSEIIIFFAFTLFDTFEITPA